MIVQFQYLSGKKSGSVRCVDRFPWVIGRAATADLPLVEPGVWDKHAQVELEPGLGVMLQMLPGALGSVNDQALDRTLLRNGDIIAIGSVKLQFWLGQTRQYSFRLRETLTWVALVGLSLGQIALIWFLQ